MTELQSRFVIKIERTIVKNLMIICNSHKKGDIFPECIYELRLIKCQILKSTYCPSLAGLINLKNDFCTSMYRYYIHVTSEFKDLVYPRKFTKQYIRRK